MGNDGSGKALAEIGVSCFLMIVAMAGLLAAIGGGLGLAVLLFRKIAGI